MGKHVFIVFAHPSTDSLNGAILNVTVETLQKQGHQVTVSDLCKMEFDPTVGAHDLSEFSAGEHKWTQAINAKACAEGRLQPYIHAEQRKLDAADLVIFQFPMYFLGFPAIMKGWFDKVCCDPYAYGIPSKIMENGGLKGKKAVLSFTTGAPSSVFSDKGLYGDMDVILWPLQSGTLRFLGFDVLPPNIGYGRDFSTDEDVRKFLSSWADRLERIFTEEPLHFFPLADYSEGELKQDVVDKAVSRGGAGPSAGQHLGMPLPGGAMRRPVSFEKTEK